MLSKFAYIRVGGSVVKEHPTSGTGPQETLGYAVTVRVAEPPLLS